MRLADCISADRLVVPLQAETLADAADALVARLASSGLVDDPLKLRQRVAEQRPDDTVSLGDRAFLVHVRTDAVGELVMAMGTSGEPICRTSAAGDEKCARIVVLIVAPPRFAAQYLQMLSALSRTLSRPEAIEAILAARTPEELAAAPELGDVELPDQLSVRDIMSDQVRTTGADHPLHDATQAMVRSGLSALPVITEDERVIGLLTERELLRHQLTQYLQGGPRGAAAPQRTVRDAMTRQVLCVSPDQPLAEVASLMVNKDIDRVPVVQEGRLVGVLARSDIVRKLFGS